MWAGLSSGSKYWFRGLFGIYLQSCGFFYENEQKVNCVIFLIFLPNIASCIDHSTYSIRKGTNLFSFLFDISIDIFWCEIQKFENTNFDTHHLILL